MLANYHTHTYRCRHAVGEEREYVENALKRGLKIFGFSDHTPQWFGIDGYYTHMRMYPDQLSEYCSVVRKLQEEYAGQLQIPLGLEVEFYPDIFGELLPRIRDEGVEYMLLGQHWPGNEYGEPYVGRPTADEQLLRRYCYQVMQALDTGLFTYVAHPDVIHFVGDAQVYRRYMRPLLQMAKQTDTPVEINLLGIQNNKHYPNPILWEMAAEERCQVILGMDAHDPASVLEPQYEQKALELVKTYDLDLIHTVPLRNI